MKKIAFTTFAAGLLIASSVGASFAQNQVQPRAFEVRQSCAPANGAQILGGFAGSNQVVCEGR